MQNEWWKSFFSDLVLDVQKQSKAGEDTIKEVDFIEKAIQLKPQAKVLDVPCGEGRHSIELAIRGYQVTGIDITESLLNEAENKAKAQRIEIEWENRDMRDLPWHREFDGAFCFWGSFGYFDEQGNLDFLKAIYQVLKPGSMFLLDTHTTETLLPRLFHERAWRRVEDTLILEERQYDHVSSRTKTEFILVQNSKVTKTESSIRLYTYRELCSLLELVGFKDFKGYGSLDFEPFRLGSPRLYLTATK
jgi:cyclopropane fatty-acyl-phospholipid synthase-like methyltransferase